MPPSSLRRFVAPSLSAFTLLELVLVLFVIALMFSLAAPSMRGWGRTGKLRDAADQFQTVARWTRSQAIATGALHQLEIDPAGAGYRVTMHDGSGFIPAAGEFGSTIRMPEGFRIELRRGDMRTTGSVEFSPTGRISPAEVRIIAPTGDAVRLAAASPTQLFEQVTP